MSNPFESAFQAVAAGAAGGTDALYVAEIAGYIAAGIGVLAGIILLGTQGAGSALGWILLIVMLGFMAVLVWNTLQNGWGKAGVARA